MTMGSDDVKFLTHVRLRFSPITRITENPRSRIHHLTYNLTKLNAL